MHIVESDVSIQGIKSAIEVKHTHDNKELLDSLISSGLAAQYLGADGEYHNVPANFSTDAFIESFNQDGTVKASKDVDGKLKLDTDNTFADNVDGKVVGSIGASNVTEHRVDLSIKKVDVRTGALSESSLKHITSGEGVSVTVVDDSLNVSLNSNETPFINKMNKVDSGVESNLLTIGVGGQAVDSGVKVIDLATKTSFDSHVENSNIHVTSQDKSNWNLKQEALTTPQLNAVNSGITSTKVSSYDAYGTTKLNVAGHANTKNVVTDSSGNIVTEDKPNLNVKIDKVSDAIVNHVPSFIAGGGLKDSGLVLGNFPSNQTVFDFMLDTIVSSVGGSIYQGTFIYFGTQAQVESIGEPVVDPVTGLSTAIIYEGSLTNFTALYKGIYVEGVWDWEAVEPAPTGGSWFEVEYSLVSDPIVAARVLIRMDGVNPASLDVRLDTVPNIDNVTIGLDSLGQLSFKTKTLNSGKSVLNSVTADNIAFEFTDDGDVDTSKTVKETINELPIISSDEVTTTVDVDNVISVTKVPNKLKIGEIEFDGSEEQIITKDTLGLGNVFNPTIYGGISYGGGGGEAGVSFTDLNSLQYSGFYTCYGTTLNVPNSEASWFVQHINSNVGVTMATQFAYAYNDNKVVYKRTKNITWGNWEKICPSNRIQNANNTSYFEAGGNILNQVENEDEGTALTQFPTGTAQGHFDITNSKQILGGYSKNDDDGENFTVNVFSGEFPTGTIVKKFVMSENGTNEDEVARIKDIPKVVSATDVVVAVADWVADTTYADYGYKASLILTGMLPTYEPTVVFGLTEVESGNFASVCLAGVNTIPIYAKEIPSSSITIPLIKGVEL